jgi:hypothetical protein
MLLQLQAACGTFIGSHHQSLLLKWLMMSVMQNSRGRTQHPQQQQQQQQRGQGARECSSSSDGRSSSFSNVVLLT